MTNRNGLIPARAGSTPLVVSRSLVVRAHPRPCGEHSVRVFRCAEIAGSSPPVRGAPVTKVIN